MAVAEGPKVFDVQCIWGSLFVSLEKKKFLSTRRLLYVKPTLCKTHARKKPAQIIIHVGTNDLPGNKNSDEIANEIIGFANSIKTSENNVAVSSIFLRKDRFNNKAKEMNKNLKDKCEEHDLQLIQHHNINPFRYTNATVYI